MTNQSTSSGQSPNNAVFWSAMCVATGVGLSAGAMVAYTYLRKQRKYYNRSEKAEQQEQINIQPSYIANGGLLSQAVPGNEVDSPVLFMSTSMRQNSKQSQHERPWYNQDSPRQQQQLDPQSVSQQQAIDRATANGHFKFQTRPSNTSVQNQKQSTKTFYNDQLSVLNSNISPRTAQWKESTDGEMSTGLSSEPSNHMVNSTQAMQSTQHTVTLTRTERAALTWGGNASGSREESAPVGNEAKNSEYNRIITPEVVVNEEIEQVCLALVRLLKLRDKWLFQPKSRDEDWLDEPKAKVISETRRGRDPFEFIPLPPYPCQLTMKDGIFRVVQAQTNGQVVDLFQLPGTAYEFFSDLHVMIKETNWGPMKTFCHHRLLLLQQKFQLHCMLNGEREFLAQKSVPHRDFYNVRKVDTHVHHSSCMHQKHLLRFIKSKLKKEGDEVVIFRDGKYLTMREVFQSLGLHEYDLNVDMLDMHADSSIFQRFDRFNQKYNPCGQSRLREIFIKTDNLIRGRYLAEITQEVFSDLENGKFQHAEYRISVYGRKAVEWDIVAAWICKYKLVSDNVQWLIQVPRLYNVYRDEGLINNYEEMIGNLFSPLFEVTADPQSHPYLHMFLQHVVAFDMVDDESKPERRVHKHMPLPSQWNNDHNPAYAYYAYYIYANLHILNQFREERGLNTFTFRPHAGEAGDTDHLIATYMLCHNISHGINLRKSPALQYLYYLQQIGLSLSPLSNNSLFLDYHKNPFPIMFARGLNVTLSTDDPLQIHLTNEPLVEEFSVATQVSKLSTTDVCEVVRNGVLISGFPPAVKKHWVGDTFWRPGPEGNDIQQTNVPDMRLQFRMDTLHAEQDLIRRGVDNAQRRAALHAGMTE